MPKTEIIETNILMALNAVMERNSENPTPLLDKEPNLKAMLGLENINVSS